jgi:hypothetical protein
MATAVHAAGTASAQDAGTDDAVAPASVTPTDPDAQRTAIARALFEEGLALADRGEWAEAGDRFRRADAVRSSPPIRFNLAHSLSRIGRVLEAVEMLHAIENDAQAAADVRASARDLRSRLERRLGRLVVELTGAPEGAQLFLDETALPAEAAGVAFPVDPGPHRVRLMSGESEIDAGDVEVGEGAEARVTLGTGADDAGGGTVFEELWFWAAVGLVVASAAVAAAIMVGADGSSSTSAMLRF